MITRRQIRHRRHRRGRDHRPQRPRPVRTSRPRQHPTQSHPVRVPHRRLHQEPVQLRLRQTIRPRLLNRVLRRDHHERTTRRVSHPVHRHLRLLHHLQQGRLRLRTRPVDLVRQHHRREHRTRMELPLPTPLIKHRHPRDITRQQIRRELDPRVRPLHRRRHRPSQSRLPRPRRVLQQQVALSQHRHQSQPHHLLLTQQSQTHITHHPRKRLRKPSRILLSHSHRISAFLSATGGHLQLRLSIMFAHWASPYLVSAPSTPIFHLPS